MMFYSQLFTSKRDSLAQIWLAAHWERKVTKANVFDCNLESTVRDIIATKMKIGLRTSGHLLMGVVRIYSRKTKYLLSDCNDAMVTIKVSFRPGQTDLPFGDHEAPIKSITLMEDFTDFDAMLPHPSEIGVVDHFSLNQSRTEEITLKEDFGKDFLELVDYGDGSQCHRQGMLDMSLSTYADTFGDEDTGYDLLDFIASFSDDTEPMEFVTEVPQQEMPETPLEIIQPIEDTGSVSSETVLLDNEEEFFALEPVPVTPTTERRRGSRRKRNLLLDRVKEMTSEDIGAQLADHTDLLALPDVAPPTAQLMQWKEKGGLFTQSSFRLGGDGAAGGGHPELMRKDSRDDQGNASVISGTVALAKQLVTPENTAEFVDFTTSNTDGSVQTSREDHVMDFSQQDLPSETDSMWVNPSGPDRWSGTETAPTTQSVLDSQDEEKRMSKRVMKLLLGLKEQGTDVFSLRTLCDGGTRSHVASTFFCLLVLSKEQAVELQQATPYGDITAGPGPMFHHL